VAIANSRLFALNELGVTFKYKDYRCKNGTKQKTMSLQTDEFIRRFMLHILPSGFHRIRHYGLLASQSKLADARRLLDVVPPDVEPTDETAADDTAPFHCRQCGRPMLVVVLLLREILPRAPSTRVLLT
jgi:hypothetical protein